MSITGGRSASAAPQSHLHDGGEIRQRSAAVTFAIRDTSGPGRGQLPS